MEPIKLWMLNEKVEILLNIPENQIKKISNITNHLYLLTVTNKLYHGFVEKSTNSYQINLELVNNSNSEMQIIDIDSCKEFLYVVNVNGKVFRCNENLEIINEIKLVEEFTCSRGHNGTKCKMKVKNIAIGEYGQLFITEEGQLWGSGFMPQIGINSEFPKRVIFFTGRIVYNANVGNDFAIAIVSKQTRPSEADSDEEDVFVSNCPQCLSASQLTSPASQTSISDICPLGVKVQGSYDIETTSTSSKNDTSVSSNEKNSLEDKSGDKVEKNIIFRNTEAAKEFLTRQFSRMSSAGEEYLVECTEKPTRIVRENLTNVASFVYEGVKTVGDKVVTLSRHVSGSSDCNSIVENLDQFHLMQSNSKEDFHMSLSLSQGTSEKDLASPEIENRANTIITMGSNLLNCEVWTWGNIIHGQLGIGDIIKRERPMIITKLSNIGVKNVSVQSHHASVCTLDGRAFIWGQNDHHQVTLENNIDQSSPKLFVLANKSDRVKDIVCGTHYTSLLTNSNELIYFGKGCENLFTLDNLESNRNCNLLCSMQYILLNNSYLNADNNFTSFLIDEQKLLEEMLTVHTNIIKPLQKKLLNSNNVELNEDLCKNYLDLLYFNAANIGSIQNFVNGNILLNDIIIFNYFEEHMHILSKYINTLEDIISIDGFQNISKLIEISQNLYKLRPELNVSKKDKNNEETISTLLLSPTERIESYVSTIEQFTEIRHECKEILHKWQEFSSEINNKRAEANKTKEFWLNSGKNIDFLKQPHRRLIKDSHKSPINLQNASRFSSHWFILFTDLFVHLNGSTPHTYNLKMIWIEPQQDENSQQYQIVLKMPEENLVLSTTEPEIKIEWFHSLQNAIKTALNKNEVLQPPLLRSGEYTFTKSGFLKDSKYTGRWLNAKMHGTGKLEWPDGKTYTGQFSNNQMNGFGMMVIPNVGTYEGQWKDNQQNGLGILTYSNTDVYKGYFKDGNPHGHGFLRQGKFMANAAAFYIGDWVNGMKNGYGVMDNISAGEKYIGNWLDNRRNGNGLIVNSEGVYYEGIFNQDVLTGQGIMILEDGTHYEGEFKGTGVLNGKGTLTLPSGHTIEGTLNGSYNEGIKISNGTFLLQNSDKKVPNTFGTLCSPVSNKWKALFRQCHQILGIPDLSNKNGTKVIDTQKIWQNVAVYLSNSTALKRNKEKQFQNSLNNLDIIPPFGRDSMSMETYLEIKNYLFKALESNYHPLGSLLNDLSEAYNTTYGGRAHPLLLTHAINELHYITKRLYEIIRYLFPALPIYGKDYLVDDTCDEIINCQSLLYPIILPKVHHPLFTLFTLKNETQERQYKRTLTEWNKQSDYTLMAFLSVDQKFFKTEQLPTSPAKNLIFLEAIEQLQQLKSTFSPMEKLLVIRQTVERMTPTAQQLLGENYVWNMDDLFPVFLYVVVRARIPDLGSELDFVENFMDPTLESGELGIMLTTLKACYQQILQEKSSSF